MVLITEIFNSAVEALCDFVEEGHNEKIRVIKDIAAAAVGISIFVWILVLGFEVLQMWRLRGVM
jgi:diacylglycerol kinase (ATP)